MKGTMEFQTLLTIFIILGMIAALTFEVAATDLIFFLALIGLVLTGVLSPEEALSGFSNPAVAAVALLFVVSTAVQNTGALNSFISWMLGTSRKGGIPVLMARMTAPVAFFSAFINNTPIVVLFAPMIKKWAEKLKLSPSKFLIPLSYAAVLGGLCTLIGTSTNLVVHGLMLQSGMEGLTLFEIGRVGLPCTIAGLVYLSVWAHRMLPDRKDVRAQVEERTKEYVVEMKVKKGCELVGKSVQQAGLRNLRGLYLMDIERGGKSLGPITPREVIFEDDRLVFVGIPSAVVELQDIPGLVPAAHKMFEQDFSKMRTHLVEAVVSAGSPILGKTVKECNFRGRYGAGVVAVHRHGERIEDKVGNIRLEAGDTLLLFTEERFTDNWKDSQDFYLISYIKDRPPDMQHKSLLVLAIIVMMILGAALAESGILPPFMGKPLTLLHFVMAASVILLLARCVPGREVKRAMRWDVLITIACALGISRAIQNSGVDSMMAGWILYFSESFGTIAALAFIYVITMLLTELLSNNAAAALVFPVAMAAATQLDVSGRPFAIAVALAASAGFMSPIGYQTHLIVQGIGGYKFGDYFRAGLPLNLLIAIVAIILIPLFWPF